MQFVESFWWLLAWISVIEYIWNVSPHNIRQMMFNFWAYRLCIWQRKAYDDVCHIILVLTHDQLNIARDLNHWGRVTYICVGDLTIIGSDNGLSLSRRQAIIWSNAGIVIIGPLGTNLSEILIEIYIFSFKKTHSKMSSGKWRPFCLGLNVLSTRRTHKLQCPYKPKRGALIESNVFSTVWYVNDQYIFCYKTRLNFHCFVSYASCYICIVNYRDTFIHDDPLRCHLRPAVKTCITFYGCHLESISVHLDQNSLYKSQ